MVFSSFPLYLDHPNLHQFQQPDHHQQGTHGVENSQILLPQPPPSGGDSVGVGVGGGGAGSIRPGSMVDRARIAKIPLPEAGMKCPRCESTNTKFCYFNNYSLTQPRHFCKTCRRYWTKGGAMRSVPVGGGCRRNKRSKSGNTLKSGGNSTERHIGGSTTTNATSISPSRCTTAMTGQFSQAPPQFPLSMAAFQNLTDYGGVNLGSALGQFQTQMLSANMGFNMGSNNLSASSVGEPWKLPSMVGYEPSSTNLFQFQSEGLETSPSMIGHLQLPSTTSISNGLNQQESSVKMEDRRELNLSKQLMNQEWNLNTWTGFSGLSSSSTSHLM